MNTNFFVAETEVFNPNKVLTRKGMDAFIGDRGIKTVELLKASGTYNNFVRCVNEKVDWDNLFTRMGEMENEAISDAIDAVAREKGIELENE